MAKNKPSSSKNDIMQRNAHDEVNTARPVYELVSHNITLDISNSLSIIEKKWDTLCSKSRNAYRNYTVFKIVNGYKMKMSTALLLASKA